MRQFLWTSLLLTVPLLATGQQNDTLKTVDPVMRNGFSISTTWSSEPTTPTTRQLGFSLGGSSERRITKNLFFYGQFLFSYITFNYWKHSVEATLIEIPLQLKIKPFKTKLRPTVAFGPNYKTGLNQSLGYFSADLTIGLEKDLKYFTIIPEVRYSYNTTLSTIYFGFNFRD